MSKYPEWSDEDEEKLRRVYPTAKKVELLKSFPSRGYRGIKLHAHKIGLYKTNVIPVLLNVPPIELSYSAGFIDGEGHIGLILAREREIVKPIITCTNTNPASIRWIHERLGGNIFESKHTRADYDRLTFRLHITGREKVSAVLTALLPYLITKKDAALKVLEWLQGRKYYEKQSERDLQYYVEVRKINARRWNYDCERFTRDEAAIESSVSERVFHGARGLSDNDREPEVTD